MEKAQNEEEGGDGMRDRERAEEERKTMLHLWKETSFWAQDLASSITAPGSRAEIRSRCEGKGENALHQVRPESGTSRVPDHRGHLQEELWGGRGTPRGLPRPAQEMRTEAGLLKQTGRVCYSYRRPELCSLLKYLAPQLLKIPWYLETNDASQAGLTACAGARQELTDVGSVPSSSITPQGTPEGPLGSHTTVFTFEHGCGTSGKKARAGGAHPTGQLDRWPGQGQTGFRAPACELNQVTEDSP